MRIVIDTNVVASAMFFGGKPEKLIDLLLKGRFNAYATEGIVAEYHETVSNLQVRYRDRPLRFALPNIVAKLNQINAVTDVHVCRDPDDDKFIGCAVDSKSKYIVSGDKDLLTVGHFEDVNIVTVADFLNEYFPSV